MCYNKDISEVGDMGKQKFADEEMKELIRYINSGVLTIDEQTAINVAIFEGVPMEDSESFEINEFGEVVREGKSVTAVSLDELERIKREMSSDRRSEIVSEM